MIATGKPVTADDAYEMGLVDAVAEDPVDHALALDAAELAARSALSSLDGPEPDEMAIDKARASVARRMPAIVKPASQTAYLTELMVRRIIDSGILPEGALQLVAGSAGDMS